jgi:hypothetical protein
MDTLVTFLLTMTGARIVFDGLAFAVAAAGVFSALVFVACLTVLRRDAADVAG